MYLKKQIIIVQWISLILTAALCGAIWRIELEHHGWHGLRWLSYFHYAIPVGYALFVFWCNLMIHVDSILKRISLIIVALLYGLLIYSLLGASIIYTFWRIPTGVLLIEIKTIPIEIFKLSRWFWPFIVLFIPLGSYLILRVFKQKITLHKLFVSIVLIIGLSVLSPYILEWINHKGSSDYIHALKSGLIIPLWVIAVGSILVGEEV